MFLFGGTGSKENAEKPTTAKPTSPLNILGPVVQGVGNILKENPVTNILETVGDIIENPAKDELDVVGENPVKDILETVGDVIKDNPVKDVLEVVGDVVKENPIKDLVGIAGDVIKENPVTDVLETVGDVLTNPIQNLLDSSNSSQLVCTNIWELPLVLMINAYLIIRNLFRDVLCSILSLLFTILQSLESLFRINGLLSIPIKNSVTAEIIRKSLEKSDLIDIAVFNIADILNPAKLVSNLSQVPMLVHGLLQNVPIVGNVLASPLALVKNLPILGGLIGDFKFFSQILAFFQNILHTLFSIFTRVKNFIIWQILTFKEILSYPYKSLKTAFQEG